MNRILIKITDLIDNSPARHDKLIYFSLFLAFLLNFFLWVLIIISFWNSKEYIILQYNIYFGISSFGSWYQLLLLPLLGLLVIVINLLISFQIYLEYQLLARIMPVMALIINIILIIVTFLLIYINLS